LSQDCSLTKSTKATTTTTTVTGAAAKVNFGPLAEANHNATPEQRAACDPDFGWLPGPEGSNKCYMLVKANGYDSTCWGSGGYYYGMTFFEGMECCYYQNAYLAEPTSEAENQMINSYLTILNSGDNANTWWLGGTDMHNEGGWLWMSGSPWSYTYWDEEEPNQNGNEDCAAINADQAYKWMDLSCDAAEHMGYPHYTICEKIVS